MPPYQVTSPWDAATSAAGSFMSGMQDERKYAQEQERLRRQEAYQQALAQQGATRLQLEQNRDTREATKAKDEEADRTTKVGQEKAISTTLSGLVPFQKPPNWAQIPPEKQNRMQADYYRQFLPTWQKLPGNEANARGLAQTIKDFDDEADKQATASALKTHEAAVAAALKAYEDATLHQTAQEEELNRGNRLTISGNEIGAANTRFAEGQAGDDRREQLRIGAAATAAHIARKFAQDQRKATAAEQEHQIYLRGDESVQTAAKKAGGAGKIDPENLKEWQTLSSGAIGNIRLSALPGALRIRLQNSVYAVGSEHTVAALKAVAAGTPSEHFTQPEAAQLLKALTGNAQ